MEAATTTASSALIAIHRANAQITMRGITTAPVVSRTGERHRSFIQARSMDFYGMRQVAVHTQGIVPFHPAPTPS